MPRPKDGYKNAAGISIPGTGDINGRFMDRSRLLYWAFGRGKAGHAKLYDNAALDIGTAVHTMAELDLKASPQRDIDFYLTATLTDPEQQAKAKAAFGAFRTWRETFHVRAYMQEISLVSEALQFGGTLDTIATIRNGLGLVDFKTTNTGEVYEDMLLQLAAYGILWAETHPHEPLTEGYHLILLPKDGSKPIHREFTHEQLHPYRQKFWLYRQAYKLDAICNDPKVLNGVAVAPSVAPETPKPKRTPKPAATVRETVMASSPSRPLSMGEMLRAYGHVREGVSA
jgi:hypothetical protein